MANKIYGIDLGTTYSCIAHVNEYQQPEIIKNFEGKDTTPSVVYFESPGQQVVGESAKEETKIHPHLVVQMVKRHMGHSDWSFEAHGEAYDPIIISSLILKKIAEDAAEHIGEPVTDVVITTPAYFGALERSATKQAGEAAGLTVHSIISEPTAAALYYGMDLDEGTIIVYDLGGGTFDITIIRLEEKACSVVITGGVHCLGGADWDMIMSGLIIEDVALQAGVPIEAVEDSAETMNDIKAEAEKMKMNLSTKEIAQMSVGFGEGADYTRYTVKVPREAFNQASESLLERTVELTRSLMQEAEEEGVEKIDKLLFVGGSTKMSQIRERLASEFPIPQELSEPDYAVAKGAAIFALKVQVEQWLDEWAKKEVPTYDATRPMHEQLNKDTEARAVEALAQEHGISTASLGALVEKQITNVTPKSFGVVVVGHDENDPDKKFVVNMIRHNEQVPTDFTKEFGTVVDNQTNVHVICVENLRDEGPDTPFEYDNLDKIGEAILELEGTLPANSPLEITLGYTQDGRINLHAREPLSGHMVETKFEADGLLSDDELSRMKKRVSHMTISS